MLLQTLGFDVVIDHPHTHVVNCCRLVKGTTQSVYLTSSVVDFGHTRGGDGIMAIMINLKFRWLRLYFISSILFTR